MRSQIGAANLDAARNGDRRDRDRRKRVATGKTDGAEPQGSLARGGGADRRTRAGPWRPSPPGRTGIAL